MENEKLRTAISHERYKQWVHYEYQQAFFWQAWSKKVIFWLSMLMAIVGLCMSFLQFASANREVRGALDIDKSSQQELELSSKLISLAIKTRSVAALILFVSLAYLVIYVLFLHPIVLVEKAPNTDSPKSSVRPEVFFEAEIPEEAVNEPQQ